MHLYVMRHGPAEDRAPTGRDADRALTSEGREVVRRVALELRRLRGGAPLPRVVASPLVRARETGDIVASICGAPEPELLDELSPDEGLPLALVAALAQGNADALLVGHQPNVEHLVRTLSGAYGRRTANPLPAGFCAALVVALRPEPPAGTSSRWHVVHVLDPRALP